MVFKCTKCLKEETAIKVYNEQPNSEEHNKNSKNFIVTRPNSDGLDGCENWGVDG